jgi:RimJ/RimL family protein N-acetyltransferase
VVVGGVGFHGPPDPEGAAEIGYGIAVSRRGRGYATEAVRQLRAIAVAHGVRRLVAGTDRDNVASARVLQSNGFRPSDPVIDRDGVAELRWVLDLTP